MPPRLLPDVQRARGDRRWTVGLLLSSEASRLTGVLVGSAGRGAGLRTEIAGCLSVAVSSATTGLFAALKGEGMSAEGSPCGRIAALRSQLAEVEAALVADLLGEARLSPAQLLAVGVHDPGLWSTGKAATGYLGLCDPARLAELTGQNIIDGFPSRDLAAGGMGGPVTAIPAGLLLRVPRQSRWILDLGRTIHATYVPPEAIAGPSGRYLAFDVGPGLRILDLLTQKLTGGEHRFDPGGRLAVQGKRIPELIEHWLADPFFKTPLPRWYPLGVRPERFLMEATRMAVERGWSVRDLLCTATHFLAESVAETFTRRLPADFAVDEILLTGGGQQNGMLLREIAARMPQTPIRRVNERGLTAETLEPAAVAILALFHLDQITASHPAITGAETFRVLGRLTPGSPQSWQRLLAEFAASRPEVRPLRSAL